MKIVLKVVLYLFILFSIFSIYFYDYFLNQSSAIKQLIRDRIYEKELIFMLNSSSQVPLINTDISFSKNSFNDNITVQTITVASIINITTNIVNKNNKEVSKYYDNENSTTKFCSFKIGNKTSKSLIL